MRVWLCCSPRRAGQPSASCRTAHASPYAGRLACGLYTTGMLLIDEPRPAYRRANGRSVCPSRPVAKEQTPWCFRCFAALRTAGTLSSVAAPCNHGAAGPSGNSGRGVRAGPVREPTKWTGLDVDGVAVLFVTRSLAGDFSLLDQRIRVAVSTNLLRTIVDRSSLKTRVKRLFGPRGPRSFFFGIFWSRQGVRATTPQLRSRS